ncbi:MAG: glutamine-hydrolyzing GMP synthase [Actinobacteria bacterium]|nr:glutamine-hydrolyzing GMP synthase [Actinomycetota bacterium]MBM3697821.1 glutamine-hydrolyzing GMP synthase [Actinomycetota bacterium]
MAFHLAPELEAQAADGVLVVDFGAQYSQLIARRVRECRVFSAIVPHDIDPAGIERIRPGGIILSGGPASVYEDGAPSLDRRLLELGIPVLGICYGMQSMAQALGGVVTNNGSGEFGRTDIRVHSRDGLFRDLPAETCWMSHRDAVTTAPEGFAVTAETPGAPIAAMEDRVGRRFGVQFHPEVVHTPFGTDMLKAFLFDACDLAPTWTAANVIDDQVKRIREQVGGQRAICGLSGGVDSAVAALLVHRAIGDNLTCVFVDHGMLRMNEGEQVEEAFGHHFHVPLVHVRAQEQFLSKLAGITDPEQKRKIIGAEFITTFDAEAAKLGNEKFLVQGTLYSDVIESGSGTNAATIKSHHNVGGLPDDMELELVEPLRQLFKDEVRLVGEELGLPERMVWRQPFPGPGLAIRIIGEVTAERLDILRQADFILQEEIRLAGLYRDLWQSFAVLPAVRSVGVQGDSRTYAYPIVIRAVTSDDAMTADWARLPHDLIEKISSRIINEVPGVNRVVLDVTSKPPGTIEWE